LFAAVAMFIALLAISFVAPVQAGDSVTTFFALATGGQEVPPVAPNASGLGVFFLYYVAVGEGGAVEGRILYWVDVDVDSLTSAPTATHFHAGAAGTNGPVIVNLSTDTIRTGVQTGNLTPRDLRPGGGINTWDDLIHGLINGNRIYWNLHTTVNP